MEELETRVRRIDEQYRAESIKIKNFETETTWITAKQNKIRGTREAIAWLIKQILMIRSLKY